MSLGPMHSTCRRFIVVWVACLSCLLPGAGAAAFDGNGEDNVALSVRFVSADKGSSSSDDPTWIDIGSMVAGNRQQSGIVMHRRVELHVDGSATTTKYVRISAALDQEVAGVTVRVDGLTISTTPSVVDSMHRIGTGVVHDIEIVVPPGAAAGPFTGNLRWIIDSD